MSKILIVEDQRIIAKDIELSLLSLGYKVAANVSSGEEAIKKAKATQPDLVLMDIVLKGEMSGIEAAQKIRESSDIPIIYLTAHADEDTLKRAKLTQPYGYILKPFRVEQLRTAIEMSLYKHMIERRLKESEERFRALYEDNPSMYYTVDEKGIILSVNKFGAEQLGYTSEELVGNSFLTLCHPDDQKVFLKHLGTCFQNPGKVFEWDFRKVRKDASVLWVRQYARTVKWADDNTVVLIVCEDITEHKKASDALRIAHDDLEIRVQERTKDLLNSNERLQSEIVERRRADAELKKAFNEIKVLKEQLEKENIYLQKEVELQYSHGEIIGESKALKAVLSQVEQVADSDTTVLLLGETGTGKELLAHAIHNLSRRRERVMVKVNCTALPSTLIESELFGYEKGAFTGAFTRKIGCFEVANGSTIFLDEIGDLPLELQPKLLRVIQEGVFHRLGNNKSIKVDVRIIAATNRNLAKAVNERSFREDLYYRLNVFPIHVPPLRERKGDIPLLIRAFINEFGERMGKSIEVIPKRVIQTLQRYQWPGNVRELRNVLERAMILNKGPTFHLQLPKIIEAPTKRGMTLEEMDKKHILEVLESSGWRVRGKGGAAEILGLKPTTLESKMHKLSIKRKIQKLRNKVLYTKYRG
jgi:PAS domain S-box-containing protein